MDRERFDLMTKTLAGGRTSRRRVLRWLAASALGLALSRLGLAETAAQEVTPTARGGCRKERKECRRDNQCCSGVCRHKKCRRSPGQGTCTIEKNICTTDGTGACNGTNDCNCVVTVTGASFCGDFESGTCSPCASNADCEVITGPGSVCARLAGEGCLGHCGEGDRFCVAPCGSGSDAREHRGVAENGPPEAP